jgi:hypothetical protein
LYTRAGFLAATILAINFAIIVGLALVLQHDCIDSTIVDHSTPETFGDFVTYEEFINTTLSREGVVREGTTTTTTTVSGCVNRNTAVLVAPYMSSLCTNTCRQGNHTYTNDGMCDDGGPGSEYDFDSESSYQKTGSSSCPLGTDCADCGVRSPPPSYSGTGIVADVPCWNQYVPCFQSIKGRALAEESISPSSKDAFGYNSYSYDEEQNASLQPSSFQPLCGWYRTSEAGVVGGPSYKFEMGRKADRFPWCSKEVHDVALRKYGRLSNLTSMDKSSVDLGIVCGMNRMNGIPVSPGGVLHPNLSPAHYHSEYLIGTMTSFITHWHLTVTIHSTVCPKFAAAFSSALAYAAYIEIIITVVLVHVFKMCALIEDKKAQNGMLVHRGRKPVDLPLDELGFKGGDVKPLPHIV